jgi:hypothetical protein
MELGISGNHALYTVIPSAWRVPVLPWPADDSGRRWASKVEYLSIVASPRPDTIEKIFRWHLFSWFLNNLAAICYADFVFDIDKIHDDSEYRRSVSETLSSKIGTGPDFTDVMKFLRYYEFEGLDVATVCSEVVSTVTTALQDGRLSRAVRVLAIQPPSTPADKAVGLLLSKIRDSLASMSSSERQHVSVAEWARTAEQHRIIWFNSRLRSIAHRIYPIAEPIVRAARRAGIWH